MLTVWGWAARPAAAAAPARPRTASASPGTAPRPPPLPPPRLLPRAPPAPLCRPADSNAGVGHGMNTNSTEVGRRGDRKRGARRTFCQRRPTILQASTQSMVKYWARRDGGRTGGGRGEWTTRCPGSLRRARSLPHFVLPLEKLHLLGATRGGTSVSSLGCSIAGSCFSAETFYFCLVHSTLSVRARVCGLLTLLRALCSSPIWPQSSLRKQPPRIPSHAAPP